MCDVQEEVESRRRCLLWEGVRDVPGLGAPTLRKRIQMLLLMVMWLITGSADDVAGIDNIKVMADSDAVVNGDVVVDACSADDVADIDCVNVMADADIVADVEDSEDVAGDKCADSDYVDDVVDTGDIDVAAVEGNGDDVGRLR
eukprot:gene21044-27915_t